MKNGLRILLDIVTVAACYLVFTSAGWSSHHIISGSLEPTLEVGDRIFVSKFAYGYNRFSVPFAPEFLGDTRLLESAPQRGDIALFHHPRELEKRMIKRVIGLPGDTVQLKAGRLYINGKLVPREAVRTVDYTDYLGNAQHVTEYSETLPGGVTHRIYERSDSDHADNTPLYVVPQDHYFMLGDNRDNSLDSRYSSGISHVHKKYLIGRADVTTFSFYDCDQGKDISCPGGVPLGRFFTLIE